MNNKRLCFLHVPKTAGTSISSILSKWYANKQIFPGLTTLDYEKFDQAEIAGYDLYKGHVQFVYAKPRLPDDTCFVTLLRDPIERAISLYYFWQAYDDDYLNDANVDETEIIGPKAAKSMGIIEFFSRDDLHLLILRETRNGQLSYLSTIKHKNSFIDKKNGKMIIKNTYENLKNISVMGIQSQLPFFVYELKQLLGISEPTLVPHINASQRNKHFANLNTNDREKLIEIITENNQAELAVYKKIEKNVNSRIQQCLKTLTD